MSEESSSSSSPAGRMAASSWTITVLIALAVYVITWPIIEIKGIQMTTGSGPAPGFVPRKPEWINIVYAPLHAMCRYHQGRNFLVRYRDWWAIIMETPI